MKQFNSLQRWYRFFATHRLVSFVALSLIVVSSFAGSLFVSRVFPAHAAGLFSSYTSAVLTNQPDAYYHLDETTGTIASDASGKNYNATYTGSFQSQTGIFGSGSDAAVQLAGDGGYVSTVNQGTPLTATTGNHDRTVELWFKTSQTNGNLFATGSPGHTSIFDISLVGDGGPGGCGSQSSAGLYVRFWDDDLHLTGLHLANSQWHYVAVTISNSGTTVSVVVDGQQPAGYVWNGSCYTSSSQAQPFSMPFPVNTAPTPIGIGNSDWGAGFNGSVDEVAIYGTALDVNQLVNHYNLGNPSSSNQNYLQAGSRHILNGQPGISHNWKVAEFSDIAGPNDFPTHPVDTSRYSVTTDFGDGLPPTQGGSIFCYYPPPPAPAPGSPPAKIFCSVKVSHTYSNSGSYIVKVTISKNDGQSVSIKNEAVIFQPANNNQSGNNQQDGNVGDTGDIRNSIGELMAFDFPYDNNAKHYYQPCTATVVHSLTKNLIVTAAHCVSDFSGHLYNHLRFAPKFTGPMCPDMANTCSNKTKTPLGVWSATPSDVTVEPFWYNNQRFDFAFVNLHPYRNNLTTNVEDAAGGATLSVNSPTNDSWTSYGYPIQNAQPNFVAGIQDVFFTKCSGTSSLSDATPGNGPQNLQIGCNQQMNAGASGGPWFNNNTYTLGAINKAFGNSFLLGTYLSDQAEIDFLKASLH
jgi:Concanavalin A-like lectin/glucanases superfamily